jgi:hypothetical protein
VATWGARPRTVVGCIFRADEQLAAVVPRLQAAAIGADDLRAGALDPARTLALCEPLGITGSLDATDPLRGLAGLSSERTTRKSVDRGGVFGAAIGALTGLIVSFTPLAAWMPVEPPARLLALVAFWFVVGTIAGAVLGAAFAPQSSSHAGFRLIDGIHDGGVVLLVAALPANADAVQRILEDGGGTGLTRL